MAPPLKLLLRAAVDHKQTPARANIAMQDIRLIALTAWLSSLSPDLGLITSSLRPASMDASSRRYFRVDREAGTFIVMDAPPIAEDSRPFVRVAEMMRSAGLNVPEVVRSDLSQGFLLLTDLGDATYLSVLNEKNAPDLFSDAIDALVRWQLATSIDQLPRYDDALLRRELQLFPDWYVARHLQRSLTPTQSDALDDVFSRLVASSLAQPTVFVHRDYMPRNLMLSSPNPGVLDFQDAVIGPVTYDIVSLLRDAFISWDAARVCEWAQLYFDRARAAGLPLQSDFDSFWRDFEWMGMQRHLKVLGIFARIRHRDGKPRYLEDAPRFVGYVRAVAQRYGELAPLTRLFDQLEMQ